MTKTATATLDNFSRARYGLLLAVTLAGCTSVPLTPPGGYPPLAPRGVYPPLAVVRAPMPLPPPVVNSPSLVSGARFIMPTRGLVIGRFDGRNNQGIDFAGAPGTPIFAAADGEVKLVSADLPQFGNMIVIGHDGNYLTAYAHNAAVLVREGDRVRQGQQIATMGSSGADRVMLHFELRKDGAPVDPQPYLDGAVGL
ncbi:MAG: M23 family metallopeptidase [Variovorax sp.]